MQLLTTVTVESHGWALQSLHTDGYTLSRAQTVSRQQPALGRTAVPGRVTSLRKPKVFLEGAGWACSA